jgi:hypothetical protein
MKRTKVLLSIVLFIFLTIIVPSQAFARLGWVFVQVPGGTSFQKIDMLSSTEGWAIGGYHGQETYYYNGLEWVSKEMLDNTLCCIRMLSSTDGWIGGWYHFYRWNGLHWNEIQPVGAPFSEFFISSIDMLNPSIGWAVGVDYTSQYDQKGVVFRWNGFAWDFFGTLLNGGQLTDVFMLSENDGWAVGWNGRIFHWNGTSWNEVFSPTSAYLSSVHMLSASDGWAVGWDGSKGVTLHWNGVQWTAVSVPPESERLRAVFMVGSNDVWAADFYGKVIIHWDGAEWTVNTQAPYELNDLDFLNASDGWVTGTYGLGHWTQVDETPPQIKNFIQYPLPHNVTDHDSVQVNVTVTDESGVATVLLCCIRSDSSVWSNTSMHVVGTDLYSGTIPACPRGITLTYVIRAQDNLGNSVSTTELGYTFSYTIIPEFPSFTILLLLMTAISLVVMGYSRKHRFLSAR